MEVNLNYTYRKLPGRNVVQEVVYNEQEWGGTIPVNDSMTVCLLGELTGMFSNQLGSVY